MRASKMVTSSSDLVTLVSPSGEILFSSASLSGLLGYEPDEIVGSNATSLIHPEDRYRSHRAFHAVLVNPATPRTIEVRVCKKDRDWCWVESTISNLLHEPRFESILICTREIGDRKTIRAQEQQHNAELMRSNAQLEDCAYAVAHDLKEPLRTISMFSELLIERVELDAKGKLLAKFIVDGVARMTALLEGLHSFALRGFEPPEPVELCHIVSETLKNLRQAIKVSRAAVTVEPLPVVYGSDIHLQRVFQNLIVNAIKYRSERPLEIHITADRLGTDWIVKVRDNGIGISPLYHERVFQLLERLHGPEISGAGIGLSICKKIIEAMGGAIWVESDTGLGSTFCFTVAAVKDSCGARLVSGCRDSMFDREEDVPTTSSPLLAENNETMRAAGV
jgi:PAS domain S-box-containing protein